jgi:hypothetical protein
MGMMKTRYEWGDDTTMEANAAVTGGRLLKVVAVGDSPVKPKVEHTTGPTEYSVGGALQDAIAGDDVTVVHRGWQKLEAAGAIAVNTNVVPAANGRVAQSAAPATDVPYGRALSATTAAGQFLWVKVYL